MDKPDEKGSTPARGQDDETRPGLGADRGTPTDKHMEENSQAKLSEKLDDALEETFPTSDPISVKITK